MARLFTTASSQHLTTSAGALGTTAHAWGSIAVIFRRTALSSGGNWQSLVYSTLISNNAIWGLALEITSTDHLWFSAGNNSAGSAESAATFAANEWYCVIVGKASGNATPRAHIFTYSTGAWVHQNIGGNQANGNTVVDRICIGSFATSSDFLNGDVAAAALYRQWSPGDAEAEAVGLQYSRSAWLTGAQRAAGGAGVWFLDQADSGMSVIDATGGGANQSGGTVPSVSANSVPLLGYAAPVVLVPSFAAAGPQTVELNAMSATATVHQATVAAGAVGVALNTLTATPTFHQATVVAGAVAVGLNAMSATPTIHTATVAPGAVVVELASMTATATFHEGSVAQIVALQAMTATATVHQATVTPGAVAVALQALTATATIHEAAVAQGAATVELVAMTATATIHEAAIAPGAVVVALQAMSATATFHEASAAVGAVTVALEALTATPTIHQASVAAAGQVVVVLATMSATPTIHQAAVATGSVTVELATMTATATISPATVAPGVVSVGLATMAATPTFHQAAITPGATTVELASMTAAAVIYTAAVGTVFNVLDPTRRALATWALNHLAAQFAEGSSRTIADLGPDLVAQLDNVDRLEAGFTTSTAGTKAGIT